MRFSEADVIQMLFRIFIWTKIYLSEFLKYGILVMTGAA
jgi:hypothetical protein